MNDHQEIDFFISHPNYQFQDPFTDLKVTLMQNQRWDNTITDLKPQFMQNNRLLYEYDEENTFPGNNEYRFFDLKNMQALSQNVRRISRDSVFTAFLKVDEPRAISRYSVTPDVNGQFVIRRLDANDSETEADYIYVDFLLAYDQPIRESDVYVFGKLTDWKLLPTFKMKYNYDRKAYQAKVLLKQGYYNFSYAILNDEEMSADLATIEGSHWETENSYQILVYNRQVGERYDRLIGFGELSSEDLY